MKTPQEYLDKGFNITPCGTKDPETGELNSKRPRLKEWQKAKATAKDFNGKDNIGLILDTCTDIDIDNAKVKEFISLGYIKPCSAIYGRKSNGRSHYVFKGQTKYKKFTLPEEFERWCKNFPHGNTLLELRSGSGHQSIVPGSTVEGEKVEWSVFEGISPYDGNIQDDVSTTAFMTAMSILYPNKGNRDDYCYAIACLLARETEMTDSVIDDMVYDIACKSKDEEATKRRGKGTHARKQIKIEGHTKGFTTLQNILGLNSMKPLYKIFEWLGVEPPDQVLEELKKQYVYLEDTAEMYDIKLKQPYKSIEFNNKWLFHFKKRPYAFQRLLMEHDFQDRKLIGRAFLPGHEYPIAEIKPGKHPLLEPGSYLNLYKEYPLEAVKGDVSKFLGHYKRIFGEKNWKHIEQFIAFILQNPGVKVRWGILIVSIEGIGKGILVRTLSRILGYQYVNENVSFKDITDKHSTIVVGQLFIIFNEVVITGEHRKKMEVSSSLKPFWTDDFLNINEKNKNQIKYLNNCNGMMFSQDKQCLHLDTSSRRYLVIHVDMEVPELLKITKEGVFEELYNFINGDGIKHLKYYFIKEVKIEEPKIYSQRAPVTDDLEAMIEDSRHPAMGKLERAFDQHLAPFNDSFCGFCSLDDLMNFMKSEWKVTYPPEALVKEWLRGHGYKWKNGKQQRQIVMQDGERPKVWLLRDSEELRKATPIELGNRTKMDQWSYHKQLEVYSHKEDCMPSLDYKYFKEIKMRKAMWYLGTEGRELIIDLHKEYIKVDADPANKKLLKKYTTTEEGMRSDGSFGKVKTIDWFGYMHDPKRKLYYTQSKETYEKHLGKNFSSSEDLFGEEEKEI